MDGWRLIGAESGHASIWTGVLQVTPFQYIQRHTITMSSPRSAPPSSDITRQHTPAADGGSAASENGGDDGAGGNVEEQLPEKVRMEHTDNSRRYIADRVYY